jgi:(p)ppGpp synthase/HD superfamily hydrolase
MSETQTITMQLLMRVKPEVHQRLVKRTLERSAELGRRVGMAFILEELLDQAEQIEHPQQREPDLFAAHD